MILAFVVFVVIAWMVSAAGAFEIPHGKKHLSPEEATELRTLFERSEHWVLIGAAALWYQIHKVIDVILALIVIIGGAFIPDIPGRKIQDTGSMNLEIPKTKFSVRGAPRFFVIAAGCAILGVVLYRLAIT
jgi:hypothetical protein